MKCAEAQLLLAPLQDEFARRYYRWCLEESRSELEAGFPSVRAVKSHLSLLFQEFAENFSRDEIRNVMICGIKRFNPRAVELLKVPASPEEEAMNQRFIDFFTEEVVWHGQRLSSVRMPKRASQIRDRELAGETTTNIKPKALKLALQKALEGHWGRPERATSSGLQFSKRFGSWHLKTSLDLAGHSQLNYSNWISTRNRIDLCPTDLEASICPMNWCGIDRGTSFDLIQATEIQEVADTVARFSVRVLEIVPELLSGLEHNLPEDMEDMPRIL